MQCKNCPLLIRPNYGEATPDYEEYCSIGEVYEPTISDEGCRIPWNKVQKILKESERRWE